MFKKITTGALHDWRWENARQSRWP